MSNDETFDVHKFTINFANIDGFEASTKIIISTAHDYDSAATVAAIVLEALHDEVDEDFFNAAVEILRDHLTRKAAALVAVQAGWQTEPSI